MGLDKVYSSSEQLQPQQEIGAAQFTTLPSVHIKLHLRSLSLPYKQEMDDALEVCKGQTRNKLFYKPEL